jgi:hypothetical protein
LLLDKLFLNSYLKTNLNMNKMNFKVYAGFGRFTEKKLGF